MSEKHEALVRRVIQEVWNKGNLSAVDEIFTPDFVGHDPVEPARGRDGVTATVQKYRTAFPDARLDIDEIFSVGERVVLRWRYSGTQRGQLDTIAPTGRKVSGTGISVYRCNKDRIQEAFENWDALGMMQQLGVVTLPGEASSAGR